MAETRQTLERALRDSWEVFREHRPIGAYLPIGQLDGDCRKCGGEWPCDAILDTLAAPASADDAGRA